MTFSRVNPGGWALYEVLTSSQMNALDINMTRALDGDGGGDYVPSSALKVHGKIIGEDVAERRFQYPIACGTAEDWADWSYDMTGSPQGWVSSVAAASKIMFSLNRFLLDDVILRDVIARVDPGLSEADLLDRISIELVELSTTGVASTIYKSYYHDSGTDTENLHMIEGHHTGGNGQSTLTDSNKSWTVGDLIGGTVYNLTDNSSGIIIANTATTITATLTGGTDNDWDTDDRYYVYANFQMNTYNAQQNIIISSANNAGIDRIYSLEIKYSEDNYLSPQ